MNEGHTVLASHCLLVLYDTWREKCSKITIRAELKIIVTINILNKMEPTI